MQSIDRPPALHWEVVEQPDALGDARRDAWDALAVASGRPFCAPGWLLPWWRHVPRPSDRLRIVVVSEGAAVVGVAPFYAGRGAAGLHQWRPLGADACQRVEPLALAGREREVARCVAEAMAAGRPDVVTLEGIPADSPWPELLRSGWPGERPPWIGRMLEVPALTIDLQATDFDAWFMARTSHFRQRLRRNRKELDKRGGEVRLATRETIAGDVAAFVRLHQARWAERDPAASVTPEVARMLADAAHELPPGDRLRVWSVDVGGRTIASSVVLVAGDEVAYWLNAFDEGHASISPSRVSILTVVEDAFSLGAARLDLGGGAFEYKRRFAEGEEPLEWVTLVPPGVLQPLTRLRLLAPKVRRFAGERLSPEAKRRFKRLAGRSGR